MDKKIRIVLSIFCGLLLLASSASAALLPAPPFSTDYLRFDQDYWTLTDIDGIADDATFILKLENAAFESDFGLYTVMPDNSLTLYNVFSYLDEQSSDANVYFNYSAGSWGIRIGDTGIFQPFSNTFGFYFGIHTGGVGDTSVDYIVYTDNKFNPGQQEFIGTWWNASNVGWIFLDDQKAFPDDNDYNDMIVKGIDIKPVPEPAAMFVFGTGLLGLFALTRKQFLR